MVINLAVVDDPHGPVFVGHWLVASGHVHDRQPTHPKPHRPPDPEPLAVGPAVAQHIAHPLEAWFIHGLPRIQLDDADDPAHGVPNCLLPRE